MRRGTAILLIGLMICANMTWFASGSVNSVNQPPNTQTPCIIINGNDTYGQNGSLSYFYLDGNLTVSSNSNLTFLDTIIEVDSSTSQLNDSGSLCLFNSSIVPADSGDRLSVRVEGTQDDHADLLMYDSEVEIPGSILIDNTTATISNSILSAGITNVSSPEQSLTISIINSTMNALGSSFSGLMRTNDTESVLVGTGVFHSSTPVSANTSLSYTFSNQVRPEAMVTEVLVNVTYSGNNPTGQNSLVFTYDNSSYTFSFPSTGNIFVDRNAVFTLNMSGAFQNLTTFENDFSTEMYMNGEIGSNSSVGNIVLSLQTNDSVDLYGLQYFNYEVQGSTVTLINSRISADTNNTSIFRNIPNPDHNGIYAVNSLINFANSSLQDTGTSPFYVLSNSTLNYYTAVTVLAHSGAYQDPGIVPSFIPRIYGSYAEMQDSLISAQLSVFKDANTSLLTPNTALLLSGFVNQTGNAYTGLYNVSIYGQNYPLSLMPYSLSGMNRVVANYSTDLPVVTSQINTTSLLEGTVNNITFTLNDLSDTDLELNYSSTVLVGGEPLNESSGNVSLSTNGTTTLQISAGIGYSASSNVSIVLDLSSSIPLWTGYYYNSSFTIPLIACQKLNMTASYRWLANQSRIGVILAFNGSKAPFPANLIVNVSTSLSNQTVFKNQTIQLNSGSNFSAQVEIPLTVKQVPECIGIGYTLVGNNPSYISSWNYVKLPVKGNDSYFPYSWVTFTENGLPESSLWSVIIDGTMYSSYTSAIEVNLSHGTYSYAVPGLSGFVTTPSSGEVSTDNSSLMIGIEFSPYLFDLNISERGLSQGSTWYVIISGRNYTSENGSMIVPLSNGTFSFSAGAEGYVVNSPSNITIAGSSVSHVLIFAAINNESASIRLVNDVVHSSLLYFGIIILLLVYLAWYKPSMKTPSNETLRKKKKK